MKLQFDKEIYSLSALLKAAFSFTDRVYIHLEQDEKYWYVSWTPKEKNDLPSAMFENEMIEQAIHERILHETAEIRKLILARAFASTILDTSDIQDTDATEEEQGSSEIEASILQGWYESSNREI